jgi:hypothetical protein
MPIRIKRRDKNTSLMQVLDSSLVKLQPPPCLRAPYTALQTVFGLLGGSP